MFVIPRTVVFDRDHVEPGVSSPPPCVYVKTATYDDFVLDVKKIKDKYCATLQVGNDPSYSTFVGISIFGTTNEKDAIEAVWEAAIRAKFAKRA